jgi:heme/copper-type cytochrome/quinol oxidase subunit 2
MDSLFEKLGRWLWWLLLVYLGLLVLESAAGMTVIMALSGPADADLTDMQRTASSSGLLTMVYSGYAQLAVFVVVAILFLRLLYKAAQRAKGFAVPFSHVSPGWAVGYWFIPIMNLYRPFQVVKALFASCAQEAGPTAKPAAGEQLLSAWWAMFLLSGIVERMLASSNTDFDTRPGITSYAEYSIGCNLLLIVATLLFAMVIKRLVRAIAGPGLAATVPGGPASMSQD